MANLSQRLRHGKALCGKVFAGFVETFNALVDFKDNLKGDRDVNPTQGHIHLDRTNPRFPVIRFVAGQENGSIPFEGGRFMAVAGSAAGSFTFENPYYSVGGRTFFVELNSISDAANHIIALSIDASKDFPAASIVKYHDYSALAAAQTNRAFYIIPLYTTEGGQIKLDWRVGPDASMGESQ